MNETDHLRETIMQEGVRFVIIRDEDFRRHQYRSLFQDLGYREVEFPTRRKPREYRLFEKKTPGISP